MSDGSSETTATELSVSFVRRHARAFGFLAFAVLSFIWFSKTWADPLHRHAGVVGDPESYMFALAWPPYAVAHHMNPFFTTYLVAPKGANLMWTIPPGFGLLLWPLTATLGLTLTYNLFATLSLAFSAWTAQLALRRFVPGELGPFVGGLFYGFSPYMAAHSLGHVMLTVAILPPLLLLLFHEALIRQRWRPAITGLGVGALFAFQLSTFLELVAAGAIVAVIFLVVLAIGFRDRIAARLHYVIVTAVAAVVSFFVLAGYQLWTLVFGAESLIHSDALLHPRNVFVTDLLGFVVPTPYSAVAPAQLVRISNHFGAVGAEANGYIGLPLLLVVVFVAVKYWRSPTVRVASIMTAVMAVLSMGPRLQIRGRSTIPLPWEFFGRLPLMQNVLPVRLSVFTDLGVAFLLAYGIGHRVRPASPTRLIARGVVAVLVVGSLLPSRILTSQLSSPVDIPSYFTSSAVKNVPKGSIALVAPWTTDPSNVLPEVWQAAAHFRFRLPSGYAYLPLGKHGFSSGRYRDPLELAMRTIGLGLAPPDLEKPAVRKQLRQLLHEHRIETVIVGPMMYQDTMVRFITDLLGRPPETVGGVYLWNRVGSTQIPR